MWSLYSTPPHPDHQAHQEAIDAFTAVLTEPSTVAIMLEARDKDDGTFVLTDTDVGEIIGRVIEIARPGVQERTGAEHGDFNAIVNAFSVGIKRALVDKGLCRDTVLA